MSYDVITKCPVCEQNLEVIKVHCQSCGTTCEGKFTLDKFNYLTREEKYFIEVFLKCRGNIKDVEKELGISYPTVRNRLDMIIKRLGYEENNTHGNESASVNKILKMLEKGEIDVEEAVWKIQAQREGKDNE